MDFIFGEYESWMKEQVVQMFCEQYGNDERQFNDYFDKFYGSYQADKTIRLVILHEKTVAGFVSFSYWPYAVNGAVANSFQCGNVIINKNFRGQGLYNKLLNYLNENAGRYSIDFVVGFPIKEIVKLYLKSGWKNPFNLAWHVKILNPFGGLFKVSDEKMGSVFAADKKHVNAVVKGGEIVLSEDQAFYEWNKAYNNISKRYYYAYSKGGDFVEFSLRINKRKYMNELIVGGINTNSDNKQFIGEAFRNLLSKARGIAGVSLVSFCANPHRKDEVLNAMLSSGFRKINREIKFIMLNFKSDERLLTNARNWVLFRRDLDTW